MLASNWAQSETSFRVSLPNWPRLGLRGWKEPWGPHEPQESQPQKEASTLDRNGSKNILQKVAQFTKCQARWSIYEPVNSVQVCEDSWDCENWKQEVRHSHVDNEIVNCSAHRFRLEGYGSDEAVPYERNEYYHAVRKGVSDSYDFRIPRAGQKQQCSVLEWFKGTQ